ncbi:hypothetical protein OKA05_27225 [Luteolibacter arcticus]|uniref:Uncharacterized protein n=1 Tax=Luteolibacter arcticus TaxID=1581411 RepID=A0ABT3GS19_9BACT|nr:hypothetical protein [Luteolibacter arcticus]MCW1926276.1 hypothetical protein [Luteolibacter arcticus]
MASGNDKEVRIGISADTAGADEAKKALEGVKAAAEGAAEAGRDFSQVSTQDLQDYKKDYAPTGADTPEPYYVAVLDELAKREKAVAEEAAKATTEIEKQTKALEEQAAAQVNLSESAKAAGVAAFDAAWQAGASVEEATEASKKATDEAVERAAVIENLAKQEAELRKKNVEAIDETTDGTRELTEESKQLRTLLIGQGLAQAGEVFGMMAGGLKDASEALRETNPEMAEAAAQGAKIVSVLGAAASGAGAGMLVFGPAGAAVGALIPLIGQGQGRSHGGEHRGAGGCARTVQRKLWQEGCGPAAQPEQADG